MRNWFRGLKLNQKFTVTTLIFIFIPLFGMMCFGFRSIKKNAIDHGVNEAVTAIDLTCAEVNAKANACSMVVDTLQEYEPLEKYLLHLRRGEEISESYYQQCQICTRSIFLPWQMVFWSSSRSCTRRKR